MNTSDMNIVHRDMILAVIDKLSGSLSKLDDPVATHTKEVLDLFRKLADNGMFVDGMVAEGKMTLSNMISRVACDMMVIMLLSNDHKDVYDKLYKAMEDIIHKTTERLSIVELFGDVSDTIH